MSSSEFLGRINWAGKVSVAVHCRRSNQIWFMSDRMTTICSWCSLYVFPAVQTVWKLLAFYGWFVNMGMRIWPLGVTLKQQWRHSSSRQSQICTADLSEFVVYLFSFKKLIGIFWYDIRFGWVLPWEVNPWKFDSVNERLPRFSQWLWYILFGWLFRGIKCCDPFASVIRYTEKRLRRGLPLPWRKKPVFGGNLTFIWKSSVNLTARKLYLVPRSNRLPCNLDGVLGRGWAQIKN
jgi:hypothetical protein